MKMHRITIVVLGLAILAAGAAPGSAENEAAVTYYRDVLPIMQENCESCHRASGQNISGLIAPMAFTSYEETRPWARTIARKVESREMPPWFASGPTGVFSNERGLNEAEFDTILQWGSAGAPAGDRADAPMPKQWVEEATDGWTLGTPDFVVKLSEPYRVEDDINDLNITFYQTLAATVDAAPEATQSVAHSAPESRPAVLKRLNLP